MDNVSLLKNLYDAFGSGDIPAVLGAMSPDVKSGKVTRFQQYVDTAKYQSIMGARP